MRRAFTSGKISRPINYNGGAGKIVERREVMASRGSASRGVTGGGSVADKLVVGEVERARRWCGVCTSLIFTNIHPPCLDTTLSPYFSCVQTRFSHIFTSICPHITQVWRLFFINIDACIQGNSKV